MASTPNPAVTIPGSGVLLHVLNPSGEPIPVQGDADGALETVSGGGGGTVDQGAAGVTSWKVVEDNSAAIKAAVEKIPAQGQALAAGSSPVVLPLTQAAGPLATEAKQPAFGTAGTPSADVASVQGVAGGTPVPTSNAAATQVDGHSATIGATGDATSANTVIGRLKNFLSRLPAALAANGGLMISTVTQTASNYLVVQDSDGTNLNPTKKVQGPYAIGGAITNPVMLGGQFSGVAIVFAGDSGNRQLVAGAAATGTAVAGNPVLTGGSDGTSARTLELKASNPLAADYGLKTREIPLQTSVVKTTAGTPAASLVVRAGPCWLFDVFASNQTATAGYLTVYDLTSAPTHGAAATARKVIGRHIDTKTGADPFNFFEDFGGLYFATGCVIVIENAEDDANTNTTAAPTLAMNAMFVAGT